MHFARNISSSPRQVALLQCVPQAYSQSHLAAEPGNNSMSRRQIFQLIFMRHDFHIQIMFSHLFPRLEQSSVATLPRKLPFSNSRICIQRSIFWKWKC